VRLSQKSATVAELRRFLAVFGDSGTFLRQCGQGFIVNLTIVWGLTVLFYALLQAL